VKKELIIVAVILALAIVTYGYINYRSKIKQLESEKLIRAVELESDYLKYSENQKKLKDCLDKVSSVFTKLPEGISYKDLEILMTAMKQKQANCYQLYPVK
jgi:hypothetical protein